MRDSSNLRDDYPPVEWNRIILTEEQAAQFLGLEIGVLRARAAFGEIPRYRPTPRGEHRYYVYDLLDYSVGPGPANAPARFDLPLLKAVDGSAPHVYVLQAESGGPMKVGVSTDVAARLEAIQSCSPLPLRVVALIEHGGLRLERNLHRALAKWRSHGEWFVDAPDVRKEVAAWASRTGGDSFASFAG